MKKKNSFVKWLCMSEIRGCSATRASNTFIQIIHPWLILISQINYFKHLLIQFQLSRKQIRTLSTKVQYFLDKMSLLIIGILLITCFDANAISQKDANVDVSCDGRNMKVEIEFQDLFEGVIFSKGFSKSSACRYMSTVGAVQRATFIIDADNCGSFVKSVNASKMIFNTLIVQNHPAIRTREDYEIEIKCEIFTIADMEINGAHRDKQMKFSLQAEKKSPCSNVCHLRVGNQLEIALYGHIDIKYKHVRVNNCLASTSETGTNQSLVLINNSGYVMNPKLFSAFKVVLNKQENLIALADMVAFQLTDADIVFITCDVELCASECNTTFTEHTIQAAESRALLKRQLKDGRSSDKSSTKSELQIGNLMQITMDAFSSGNRKGRDNGHFIRKISVRDKKLEQTVNGKTIPSTKSDIEVPQSDGETFSNVKFNVRTSLRILENYDENNAFSFENNVLMVCYPKLQFVVVLFLLISIIIVLLYACVLLAMYIRQQTKKNKINSFLLYSYK